MAFSLRLTGMKWNNGGSTVVPIPNDVPGGGAKASDSRFRQISQNHGYLDYFAVLSRDEALQLVQERQPLVESWMRLDPQSPARSRYEATLDAIRESDVVIANCYEWESGFGD